MQGRGSVCAAVIAGFMIVTVAPAQEKRIRRSHLPPAVEKTVSGFAANARVRGFTEERENGQTFYEAELLIDGRSRDVLMDAAGNIVEVEEQVPIDRLPPAVKAALVARAGKGRILNVESIAKPDKIVAYEAHVSTHGKRSEIQVGPNGEQLDHEE